MTFLKAKYGQQYNSLRAVYILIKNTEVIHCAERNIEWCCADARQEYDTIR